MGSDKRGIDARTEGWTGGRRRENGSQPTEDDVELQYRGNSLTTQFFCQACAVAVQKKEEKSINQITGKNPT